MKVIKIGAVWCNGCLVMRPRWLEIEKENPWLQTQYLDFDQDKELVKVYQVEGGNLPVFIFIDKNEHEFFRITGEVDKNKLLDLINKYKEK